jgi:haloalkane dehalogenase
VTTEAAIRVERPPWLLERLFPFKSHYIDIIGAQIHYIDEGSGPTLLLLHGNPTWSFLYRDIVKGLRDRFRCIALDYPGFGLSKAPPGYDFTPAAHAEIVERFVLALGLEGLTLMVQDWGGPIGLGVAGRHAQRIRGLIIGNTFAWPVDGDPHFERFARLAGGPIGAFLVRNFNILVNYLIPAGVKRRKLSKEIMAAYRGPFFKRQSRSATHIFPREILRSRGFLRDVEGGLSRLAQLPVLILWGDRDIAFRETERVRFERTFPRQRTVVLSGAGHFIQEDAAEEIVHTIRTWYDEEVERPEDHSSEHASKGS